MLRCLPWSAQASWAARRVRRLGRLVKVQSQPKDFLLQMKNPPGFFSPWRVPLLAKPSKDITRSSKERAWCGSLQHQQGGEFWLRKLLLGSQFPVGFALSPPGRTNKPFWGGFPPAALCQQHPCPPACTLQPGRAHGSPSLRAGDAGTPAPSLHQKLLPLPGRRKRKLNANKEKLVIMREILPRWEP